MADALVRTLAAFIAIATIPIVACGQDVELAEFRAITLVTDGISRAWLLPNDNRACKQRLTSERVPCRYLIPEDDFSPFLGSFKLSNGTNFRKVTVRDLTLSPTLDGIDFTGIGLTDNSLESLTESQTLKHLILDNNALTDDAIQWIAEIPNLETISLHKTKMSKQGFSELACRCHNLRINTEIPGQLAVFDDLSKVPAATATYLN